MISIILVLKLISLQLINMPFKLIKGQIQIIISIKRMSKFQNHSDIYQKSLFFRNQIRDKQIQSYKRKIREQFSQHNNPNLFHFKQYAQSTTSNQSSSSITRKQFQNSSCAFQQQKKAQGLHAEYWRELEHIKKQLQTICDRIDNDSSKLFQEEIQIIINSYDQLLNLLVIIEEADAKQSNGSMIACVLNSSSLSLTTEILYIIQYFSRKTMKYWQVQQRCIISYSFCRYLKIVELQISNQFTMSSFIDRMNELRKMLRWIDFILVYTLQILNKERKQKKEQQGLDFTTLQQQILQRSSKILNQILNIFYSQIGQLNLPISNDLYRQIMVVYVGINKNLTTLSLAYNKYLVLYREEYQARSFAVLQSCKSKVDIEPIGDIGLGTIKSVMRMSVQMLYSFTEIKSNVQIHSRQGQCQQEQNESQMMIQSFINQIISLIKTFFETINRKDQDKLSLLPQMEVCLQQKSIQQQIKKIQDETSDGIYGTMLGIIFRLTDAILDIIQTFEVPSEESQQTMKQKRQWFSGINHTELIRLLTKMLEDRLYKQEYVEELYKESKMCTYLLTYIFSLEYPNEQNLQRRSKIENIFESSDENKYMESYREFRSRKSQFTSKICTEIQCLKCIEQFMKNYRIKVDEEDNLPIRYISKIGNGEPNRYYFRHLAPSSS